MTLRLSPPRLLPMTIVVMLLLLFARAATFAKDAAVALGLTSASSGSVSPAASAMSIADTPAAKAGADVGTTQPPTMDISKSELALLQDLRRRREKLDAREQALQERDNVMEATEEQLQSKIDHLNELQDRLDQNEAAHKQRQSASWGGLVKVYESMKPRDAAAIFDVLDMRVLLEVVDRMNERKVAAILAAMQPERARLTTQMLAQMRLRRDALTLPADPENAQSLKTAE